jgi:hypothetical protein
MLTSAQLTAIDQHLRKENWLLNEDLIAELTDHYVNGISERLAQDMAFDMALREMHTGFGGRKGLLKMEEDYQVQTHRKRGMLEWQLVRSFMHGSRWPITACLFIGLYATNAYTDAEDIVRNGLGVGFLCTTFGVLAAVTQSLFFFYRNRHEVSQAATQPGSPVFIIAYLLSMSLLLINKHGFAKYGSDLPVSTVLTLETLLETLCLVYYMALVLALRQVFLNSRNRQRHKPA